MMKPGDGKKQYKRNVAEEIAIERGMETPDPKVADKDKLLQELHVHQIELELQNEELRQAQAKLEYTHQQYLDLYNEAPVGYASLDDSGLILRTNRMLARLLGVERNVLKGRALVQFMMPEDQGVFRARFRAFVNQPNGKHIDVRFRKGESIQSTDSFVGRIQGRRIAVDEKDENRIGWEETLLIVISDVTELKKSEEKIHYQAYHDELTGLPNRTNLYERLATSLSVAKRHHTYGAVLFMDLDRFKNVNDSLGHHTGDKLLIEFAERMRERIRQEDLLIRMGGDEFLVLFAEQYGSSNSAAVNAQRFAEHINESLQEPLAVGDHLFQVSLSIGIGIYPFHHEDSVDDVIRQADTAMYQAKNDGRGKVRFFHAQMQDSVRERMTLEAELRLAMQEQQFEIYYQPQVNPDGSIRALEALLRWQHPYRGIVAPDRFIGITEDTGMIVPLGEWVIDSVTRQIAKWRDSGQVDEAFRFSINVSSRQLEDKHFSKRVEEMLQRHGVASSQLIFEITESLLLPEDEESKEVLNRLSELGVVFSIDDFGTGFSSLAVMQTAPIGQLKIDKRFIRDLQPQDIDDPDGEHEKQRALVDAILSLAKALGLEVVAEGVETELQSKVLLELGCRFMQGFYYLKPQPAEQISQLLVRP